MTLDSATRSPEGEARQCQEDTKLPRMAALPRWSRMPILLQRWEMASPLLLPNVPCEVSAQLLHLSPCTNMPASKRCLVSYTPLLSRSFFSQRHGSKRDRLCGPLLAWWQPGALRLPQVLIKPRKTAGVHWWQREGGLLSLVNIKSTHRPTLLSQ